MKTAIQQIQLRDYWKSFNQAQEMLKTLETLGFDGIEINGFMIRKMPWTIRLLTQMAGMGIGNSGRLDWMKLLSESSLEVTALHDYLGHILDSPDEVAAEATALGTQNIVITGLRKFDFSNKKSVLTLADQLNQAGQLLSDKGLTLSYHNHNCEFQRVTEVQTAYELLLEATEGKWLSFEVDVFWAAEAGVDVVNLLKRVGNRQHLLHLTDRGIRSKGETGSILKSDCMELGTGNMNLEGILTQSQTNGIETVVIETHRNYVDDSALESAKKSLQYLQNR